MLTGNTNALINALAVHRSATKRAERELVNSRSAITTLGDDAVDGQDDTLIARLDMTEFDATCAEVTRILNATELEPEEESV